MLRDVRRRHAQNAEALALHELVPSPIPIPLIPGVSATIDFENQARLHTAEVGEVRSDRMLTPEAQAAELLVAKVSPEDPIGLGGLSPELSRMLRTFVTAGR